MKRYTIRYRATDRRGQTVLIVDDARGTPYLFAGESLQRPVTGADAGAALARQLAHEAIWLRVPAVSPYTLAELRHLLAAPGTTAGAVRA